MIVWALFDSGNGSYTKAINTLNSSGGANIEVYPIGIDIENKNSHFIHLNLADYSRLFGDNKLFDTLDKLPHPDLIIASPPCESWSNASAIANGNACWKQEDLSDSLFEPQIPPSMFTIRANKDYIETIIGFPLPYKNPTRYNNYDYPLQKPTKFASNLFLNLNNDINPAEVEWGNFSKSYNERSNIPQKLLLDIFQTVLNQFEKEKQNDTI